MTDEEIGNWGVTRCYERYGGMMQVSPLTPDEQKYDDTCRAIDALQAEISGMSAALFTAGEMIWFSAFVQKLHMLPNQEQLDRQLKSLADLRDMLQSRRHG
jgi:hypothetical protein